MGLDAGARVHTGTLTAYELKETHSRLHFTPSLSHSSTTPPLRTSLRCGVIRSLMGGLSRQRNVWSDEREGYQVVAAAQEDHLHLFHPLKDILEHIESAKDTAATARG